MWLSAQFAWPAVAVKPELVPIELLIVSVPSNAYPPVGLVVLRPIDTWLSAVVPYLKVSFMPEMLPTCTSPILVTPSYSPPYLDQEHVVMSAGITGPWVDIHLWRMAGNAGMRIAWPRNCAATMRFPEAASTSTGTEMYC